LNERILAALAERNNFTPAWEKRTIREIENNLGDSSFLDLNGMIYSGIYVVHPSGPLHRH
jgi:hypothetical protein